LVLAKLDGCFFSSAWEATWPLALVGDAVSDLAARVLDLFGDGESSLAPSNCEAAAGPLDFAGDVDLFFSPAAPSASDWGDFAGDDARLGLAGECGGFSATAAASGSAPAPPGCAGDFLGDGAAFFALPAAARAFPISTSATVRFPPAPPPGADIPAAAAAAGAGTAPARLALAAGGFFSADLAAAAAAVAQRGGEAADAEEEGAAKGRGGRKEGRRCVGGARARVLGEGGRRHRRRSGEVVEVEVARSRRNMRTANRGGGGF